MGVQLRMYVVGDRCRRPSECRPPSEASTTDQKPRHLAVPYPLDRAASLPETWVGDTVVRHLVFPHRSPIPPENVAIPVFRHSI